jgi:hypothetical protein
MLSKFTKATFLKARKDEKTNNLKLIKKKSFLLFESKSLGMRVKISFLSDEAFPTKDSQKMFPPDNSFFNSSLAASGNKLERFQN